MGCRGSVVTSCRYLSDCSVQCAPGTLNRKQVYNNIKTPTEGSKHSAKTILKSVISTLLVNAVLEVSGAAYC